MTKSESAELKATYERNELSVFVSTVWPERVMASEGAESYERVVVYESTVVYERVAEHSASTVESERVFNLKRTVDLERVSQVERIEVHERVVHRECAGTSGTNLMR